MSSVSPRLEEKKVEDPHDFSLQYAEEEGLEALWVEENHENPHSSSMTKRDSTTIRLFETVPNKPMEDQQDVSTLGLESFSETVSYEDAEQVHGNRNSLPGGNSKTPSLYSYGSPVSKKQQQSSNETAGTPSTLNTTLESSFEETTNSHKNSTRAPTKKKKMGLFGRNRKSNNRKKESSKSMPQEEDDDDETLFVPDEELANIRMASSSRQRSKPVERFVATVVEKDDTDDLRNLSLHNAADDQDAVTVRGMEDAMDQQLQQAMLDDDDESVASLDGIKKFTQGSDQPCPILVPNQVSGRVLAPKPKKKNSLWSRNNEKPAHRGHSQHRNDYDDDEEAPAPQPPRHPEFISAPQGVHPAILIQTSWDSLLSQEAALPEDAPTIIIGDEEDHDEQHGPPPSTVQVPMASPPRDGEKIQFRRAPTAENTSILSTDEGSVKSQKNAKKTQSKSSTNGGLVRNLFNKSSSSSTDNTTATPNSDHSLKNNPEPEPEVQQSQDRYRAVAASPEPIQQQQEEEAPQAPTQKITLFAYQESGDDSAEAALTRIVSAKSVQFSDDTKPSVGVASPQRVPSTMSMSSERRRSATNIHKARMPSYVEETFQF
mmetsp:Transcript_10099/g.20847  ORF Transcript_10099/g.20847 Transcript_10099/m.20847 type:complete len:601 (-) Transcript_10099:140-1942(-)